ncbi:MAG: hypothetical protein IJU30_06405 [Lachnospiraceae bacterium]|nr:hypothetical protein [Lachnospiraceae bacterium]
MIKKHYSKASRRALNIIWNAAGRYDLDPPFMAFHANGQADDYFNTIIGLADKWLDLKEVAAFFASYAAHPKAEEFDEFLWLGLENHLYERELPERPALTGLRKKRGEQFFLVQQTLSEQQMTMQSMPVYRQQQARWAIVTGRHLPLLSPKEEKMAEALAFSGSWNKEEVLQAMRDFLKEFYHYDPVSDPRTQRPVTGFRAWYRKLNSHEYKQNDILLIRTGSGLGDPANAVALSWEDRIAAPQTDRKQEEDARYIRDVFGGSVLSDEELHQAESLLCTDNDKGCRLWITAPGKGRSEARGKEPAGSRSYRVEIEDTRRRRKTQEEHNRRYLKDNRRTVQGSIQRLSSELDTWLSSFLKGMPEAARAGALLPQKAYRIDVLHDPFVFVRDGEEKDIRLRVDLLLDASQSRMNSQERIAAEAYVIAKSLEQNHVPVRVTTFRSLRGFTVLEKLKEASDRSCDDILRYYAGGWNRDGLALKCMRYLIKEDKRSAEDLHLLLILTDASPNDTVAGSAFGKNYEGAVAVDDAAAAVKALRADGIRTAAVFHGSTSHLENVYRIFGKEYIRVMSFRQFADGVIDLMQKVMQETG